MTLEAEQAVVAKCIENAKAYDLASEHLRPDDFTDDRMKLLYELTGKMRELGKTPDPITLSVICGKSQRWVSTGLDDPLTYIHGLIESTRSFQATKQYIDNIRSESAGRAMLNYCGELANVAYDVNLDASEKLAAMHALMPSMDVGGDEFLAYADAAKLAVRQILDRASGDINGVTSGVDSIDRMTGGFEPGTLVILAGRPSHGKSIYGMQFAHAACKTGPVLVFSLEMTSANLAMRGLSSIGMVDFGDMRKGQISDHAQASIINAQRLMMDMPIFVDDRGGISVDQLRTRARVMSRKGKPSMIVTDYLTLLHGVGENRTAQVGYVSRSLKAMAKELDCPVVCIAQLNRGVDNRSDRRPTLSDLRDSGEIEQDADIVMFSYLHEKYVPETQRKGIGELIFAKQRNGETGSVFTEWQGRYQRFVQFDGAVPSEDPEGAANDEKNAVPLKPFRGSSLKGNKRSTPDREAF